MKKIYLAVLAFVTISSAYAQTPYQRIYTILNTKCQNSTCHSATSADALKFDGTETEVYNAIKNTDPTTASAAARFEKNIKPGHPYMSFLLKKVSAGVFDTDLSLEANDGAPMNDINGQPLSNIEIEFIRQWVMYSAKQTYTGNAPKPEWQLISDYYNDTARIGFLNKPIKPAAGTGMQLRMGPVFLPYTGKTEQEWLLQQEVNFPYLAQVSRLEGFMNQQSHHFLLFRFDDSVAATYRPMGMTEVLLAGGTTSFDGDKGLTGAWQDDAELSLPQGTALFWPQKTYLDMNYHIKNSNSVKVLPCDFYYNVYFVPRNPNTIEMKSNLVNNAALFLPQGIQTRNYDDPDNNDGAEMRYMWMMSSHTHKYGTDFDLYSRDENGLSEKIYEGFYSYENNFDKGFYDWEHPSIRYWPDLKPMQFGQVNGNNTGVYATTEWNIQESFVTFGFTTEDEMQLWYYMYTTQDPAAIGINEADANDIMFKVVPNPNNGTGALMYTLDNSAKVSATVIDVTGKEVAVLSEENQAKGTHTITIGNNESFAKGIYFARLNINGKTYTKKFVVSE
jgi:hypothetical protein